jgi:hypothetical protein
LRSIFSVSSIGLKILNQGAPGVPSPHKLPTSFSNFLSNCSFSEVALQMLSCCHNQSRFCNSIDLSNHVQFSAVL